jgi:hypothetical protein
MLDDRDRLIAILIRKLGGRVEVGDKELLDVDHYTMVTREDIFTNVTVYTVQYPDDDQQPTSPVHVEPKQLIAALMDYAREVDLTFSRDYLETQMERYAVEVTDNHVATGIPHRPGRMAPAVRIRMWEKRGKQPPSKFNTPPPPISPVQAQATRLSPLELEGSTDD